MEEPTEFIKWCNWRHDHYANHYYAEEFNIKYSFHLNAVRSLCEKWSYLILDGLDTFKKNKSLLVLSAIASGHDILEDTRLSYNDLIAQLKKTHFDNLVEEIAEGIWTLTEYRGKTRSERHPLEYYENIAKSDLTLLVKLCDILANSYWAKLKGKDPMAKKEWDHIKPLLYKEKFNSLFLEIENLF
jgi:hypothetical protein